MLNDEEEAWVIDPAGPGMIRQWGGDQMERPLWEERRRRRALGGTPLGHMADPEWLGRVTWVQAGPLRRGKKHDRLGGGPPLALM